MTFIKPEPQSFDEAYYQMFESTIEFFRYAKRHPDDELMKYFDEDFYAKAAATLKDRIDHEIKHLHSPYLD